MILPDNDQELIEFLCKHTWDKTSKYAYYTESGIVDTFKQIGFYKDVDENMELTLPLGMPNRACADQIMTFAKDAIKMPKASEAMHLLMAVRYSQEPVFGTPKEFLPARAAGVRALKQWAEQSGDDTSDPPIAMQDNN